MSYNGSGTFVINTAGQPVVSGTVISSTAFNALTADLANGLSTAITKDGQTTPTANIPMGNNKITGLAVGTAATDAATLGQVQSTAAKLINSVSGADTITGTLSPTLTAYAAGQMFYFVAASDNTGAVTLNINSLGAKSVTRDGTTALVAGDIKSGEVCVVVYDGTQFQLVNAANSFGDLNVTGNLTLSGGTANGVLYLNASKVATSGSALVFDGTNLGIGTSSPAAKLDVNGASVVRGFLTTTDAIKLGANTSAPASTDAFIYRPADNTLAFGTANTERARITAAGELLVGTTTVSGKLTSSTSANTTYSGWFDSSAASGALRGVQIKYSGQSPNDAGNAMFVCADSTATRMYVNSNGGIGNYQTNDVNLSDERVKQDIKPLGSMWNKFKALEIVTFKYKDQTHDDDNIGVVAQQVESVAPEFVDADGWGETPDDGVPLKSIYTADMYHAAIKALQEAMSRIEALETKVAALEAK